MNTVLIVEDVDAMRSLLEQLLAAAPGLKVSGTARNGWEARIELQRRRPDLVLLDEILPGESSVDLLAEFVGSGVKVLLMTGLEDPTHPLPPGASGRIIKPGWDLLDEEGPRMLAAIQAVLSS